MLRDFYPDLRADGALDRLMAELGWAGRHLEGGGVRAGLTSPRGPRGVETSRNKPNWGWFEPGCRQGIRLGPGAWQKPWLRALIFVIAQVFVPHVTCRRRQAWAGVH